MLKAKQERAASFVVRCPIKTDMPNACKLNSQLAELKTYPSPLVNGPDSILKSTGNSNHPRKHFKLPARRHTMPTSNCAYPVVTPTEWAIPLEGRNRLRTDGVRGCRGRNPERRPTFRQKFVAMFLWVWQPDKHASNFINDGLM